MKTPYSLGSCHFLDFPTNFCIFFNILYTQGIYSGLTNPAKLFYLDQCPQYDIYQKKGQWTH